MRISESFNTKSLIIEIPYDEVCEMLELNKDVLNELGALIEKWKTWTDDVKRIKTKEIFQRANPQ